VNENSSKFVRKDAKKYWLHKALPVVAIYILLVFIAYTYIFFSTVLIIKESGDIWFVKLILFFITVIFILASMQISIMLYVEYPPAKYQYEINLDDPQSLVSKILLDYLKFYSQKETPRYIIADVPYVGRVFYNKSKFNCIFTDEVKDEQICRFIEDLENKVHSVLKNGYYTKMSISRCEMYFPLYPQNFIIEFRACGGTVLKNGIIFKVLYHPKYGKMYMPKMKTRYTVVYTDMEDEQQIKEFISLILHSARK